MNTVSYNFSKKGECLYINIGKIVTNIKVIVRNKITFLNADTLYDFKTGPIVNKKKICTNNLMSLITYENKDNVVSIYIKATHFCEKLNKFINRLCETYKSVEHTVIDLDFEEELHIKQWFLNLKSLWLTGEVNSKNTYPPLPIDLEEIWFGYNYVQRNIYAFSYITNILATSQEIWFPGSNNMNSIIWNSRLPLIEKEIKKLSSLNKDIINIIFNYIHVSNAY